VKQNLDFLVHIIQNSKLVNAIIPIHTLMILEDRNQLISIHQRERSPHNFRNIKMIRITLEMQLLKN
jgi:hypothetical protein